MQDGTFLSCKTYNTQVPKDHNLWELFISLFLNCKRSGQMPSNGGGRKKLLFVWWIENKCVTLQLKQ